MENLRVDAHFQLSNLGLRPLRLGGRNALVPIEIGGVEENQKIATLLGKSHDNLVIRSIAQ